MSAELLTTQQRLRVVLLRERAARRAAQQQALVLEQQLDAREDADLARELGLGPGDRLSDDLSHVVRAPRPEPTAPTAAPPTEAS